MNSIPQLRQDINDLQSKLDAAQAEIRSLKSNLSGVTVYIDNPELVAMVKRLQEKVRNANIL